MLQINELKVRYFNSGSDVVSGVRLSIPESCIFALLGESGCGKTTLGLSITNLISPKDGRIMFGSVIFNGRNILRVPKDELRNIRGKDISYIFQEPATSLNPVFTIGEQICEALLIHRLANKSSAKKMAMGALIEAGLEDNARVFNSYPHQLSGGMKQRAMIAMAISTRPKLLIADEPTTALDIDTEAEILNLLLLLRKNLSMSVLFITHNIRIVKKIADRVAIMRNGGIVEIGEASKILTFPKHPYTKMLIDSMPEKLKLYNKKT